MSFAIRFAVFTDIRADSMINVWIRKFNNSTQIDAAAKFNDAGER